MEYLSVIFFKGGKAYYKVTSENGKMFKACLQRFDGAGAHPPHNLSFYREGNNCLGDADIIDLISDLSESLHKESNIDDIIKHMNKKKKE